MFLKTLGLRSESSAMLHLDALRFIAACAVVLFHWAGYVAGASWLLSRIHLKFLNLSVDLFFVISGVVMYSVYSRRLGTIAQFETFLRRRFARLYPLHIATLMLLLLPALMIHFGVIGTDHPDHYDLRGFVPQLFLLQSFPILHNVPFNSPSWSISAEMICYCFLPVLLWMHRRWSPTLPLVISMAVAALIAFAGDSWLTWTYQWSFLRAFPSFAFGLFLGHHREKLSRIPCAKTLMIALGVILLAMGLNGAPYLACFACLYVFMLAACACDAQSISTRLTKLAPLSALTYSIYMLHDMVEHFGMGKLAKSTAKISPILANSIVLCGFIALFIIAYLSFTYFENPARNYLSGKRKPLSTTYSLPKGTPIAPELQP